MVAVVNSFWLNVYHFMHSSYKKRVVLCVSILVGTIKSLKDHVFEFFMCVWKKHFRMT